MSWMNQSGEQVERPSGHTPSDGWDSVIKRLAAMMLKDGLSIREVASYFGATTAWVRKIAKEINESPPARRRRAEPMPSEREFVPLFPIGQFTPTSECPHRGPIKRDSSFVCMCEPCGYSSGYDDHPRMRITAQDRERLASFGEGPTKYEPDENLKGGR